MARMGLLGDFLITLGDRARHRKHRAASRRCDDPRIALDVLRYLDRHPQENALTLDTAHGKATFDRSDIPRLRLITKQSGVGERIFARTMSGGTAYGNPGGWSQDRNEMVLHYRSWVYIAIRAIWQRISRHSPNVGWVTPGLPTGQQMKGRGWYHRKSNQAIKPHEDVMPCPPEHPLVKLFANPNKPDVPCDLWYELGLFLELTGNSYLWTVPSNLGLLDKTYKAAELWVIPSNWVWPRIGRDRLIEYYEIRPWIGQGTLKFPPEDVIHLRFKSPIHKIDGYSPQYAGAELIDTGESVNRSRFYQFKNGAWPAGNLKLGPQYSDLDDEDLERLYARLDARLQGEHNHGRPIITPPDSEYVPLTINPKEMAYIETADQLRDWILALWGVPKEVAGIQDAGSEIAMYGPLRQFSENCLIPRLVYLGQVLTEKLAYRWDRRLRVWWDDPTPDDPEQKREDLKMRYDTQSITSNEIRSEYGDPPLPGGDAISDPRPNLPPAGVPGTSVGGNNGAPAFGGKRFSHANGNGNGHA